MKLNYYLSLAALIPAAILFVRIYQLDHIEKEPRRLLGKLVLFGALAAVPAALAQLLLTRAAGAALGRSTVWYLLLDNFVIVACSEELAKLLPVRLAAWDHPAFDYRFDAIVYSVSSALGFAAGSRWAVIAFYAFVAAFFITADVCLRRASRTDSRL